MSDNKIGDVANTELESPGWLNAALVKEALRRGGEENYDVKQMTLKPAIAPGENYMSAIYRAVLNATAPGHQPPLTARGLHHGSSPSDFLVLEDLAPQGFKLANRQEGLDLGHSLLALRTLACFHAASVEVLQQNPKVLEGLRNMFVQGTESFKSFVLTSMESIADAFRSWPGFTEYALCLDKLKPHIIAKFAELNKPKPERFKVILHGDFWINNMLFRYEDGAPQEVRLVDLQLSRVASPALDLLNFLSSSVSEDVSVHHEDLLLRGYHKALSEAMKLLKQEPPSLEDLLEDIDSHGTFALFGSLCGLPVIKAQKFVDLDAVVSGDNSGTVSLYEDPTVKRWLQRLLPEYKRKGWLPS